MYEPVALKPVAEPAAIHWVAPKIHRPARIEAFVDRGPILELTVNCSRGTAILSYSKSERIFCNPVGTCSPHREAIIEQTCR